MADENDAVDPAAAEHDDEVGSGNVSGGGISQLFAACDLNGSGFIEPEELRAICDELTSEELADVFKQLDSDQDGQISVEEFAHGFQVMT